MEKKIASKMRKESIQLGKARSAENEKKEKQKGGNRKCFTGF